VALLTVCAPLAMGLFLLLMERLEAVLLPERPTDEPAGVVVPAPASAEAS
jgi:hypothetical protein